MKAIIVGGLIGLFFILHAGIINGFSTITYAYLTTLIFITTLLLFESRNPTAKTGLIISFSSMFLAFTAIIQYGPYLGVGWIFAFSILEAAIFGSLFTSILWTFTFLVGMYFVYPYLPFDISKVAWARITTTSVLVSSATAAIVSFILSWMNKAHLQLVAALAFERKSRVEQTRIQAELAQSLHYEAIARLAGGVAHNVNNALMIIEGNACLLNEALHESPELKELVADIISASRSTADIVSGLQETGKAQQFKLKTSQFTCELSPLLERITRSLNRTFKNKTNIILNNTTNATIMISESDLEQVLINLATNARDAMHGEGTITFSAHEDDESNIIIKVSDEGEELPKDSEQHIFDPYFTTKEPEKGTGLGLSSANGLILAAGGTLSAENNPEVGASFSIRLPIST